MMTHEKQEDGQWKKCFWSVNSKPGLPSQSNVTLAVHFIFSFRCFFCMFHIHRIHRLLLLPICWTKYPFVTHFCFAAGKCNVAYWSFHTELKLMGCAAEPSVADCLRALQLAAEERGVLQWYTPSTCNTEPANWWLEDYFLFGKAFFSGAMLVYLRVESNSSRHDLQNKGKKASVSETVTWRLQNTRFFKDISLASRYPWTVTRYSVSNTSSTQELTWVLVLC